MRKENKKEKWAKPKLIVLTRGKPDERLLSGCKADLGGVVLPGGSRNQCAHYPPSPGCTYCLNLASS